MNLRDDLAWHLGAHYGGDKEFDYETVDVFLDWLDEHARRIQGVGVRKYFTARVIHEVADVLRWETNNEEVRVTKR